MNQFYKNLALWLVISLVMILLFNMMTQKSPEQQQISYSNFLSALENGQVQEVTIQGSDTSRGNSKTTLCSKPLSPTIPAWSANCAKEAC